MSFEVYRGVRLNLDTDMGQMKKCILDNPDLNVEQTLEKLDWVVDKSTRQYFYSARLAIRNTKRTEKTKKKKPIRKEERDTTIQVLATLGKPKEEKESNPPLRIKVGLPAEGIELKIDNGSGMLATICISHDGLTVVKANSKNPHPRIMTWRTLESISQLGLAAD